MKAFLAKKSKKKKKKVKREKKDKTYNDDTFDPAQFVTGEENDFGWTSQLAQQKQFRPEAESANFDETEEEAVLREARQSGNIEPADAPGPDIDFGPTLPDSGIPARAETGAIPGKHFEDNKKIQIKYLIII